MRPTFARTSSAASGFRFCGMIELPVVNLSDKFGNDRFNPPSLLGVGQRGPYFHDNRAKKLADVFRTYGHQLDRELDEKELADLQPP